MAMTRDSVKAKPPADAPPAPAAPAEVALPVAVAPDPTTDHAVSWVLPASVMAAAKAAPDRPTYSDRRCASCNSPLFFALPIVRVARGYQDGQRRGLLFVCLGCQAVLNPEEVEDAARLGTEPR